MIIYKDEKYDFYEIFNEKNGVLIRSNVLGTKFDPYMRSFPELIDIGIMGRCESGENGYCKRAGIDCYQNAVGKKRNDISLSDYMQILQECAGKTFQVALGGAGDPNKHSKFEEILKITKRYGIVPNITTSGFLLTDNEIALIKKYCGAVAVSFYSRLNDKLEETNKTTIETINRFISQECVTNIHFVVSKDTIDEAIYRLENNLFSKGINAVIFILYKPVGLGNIEKVVSIHNEKILTLLKVATDKVYSYKIGFDTCFTSGLVKLENGIANQSIDACEAARFSMYIDSDMNAYPCSFDCDNEKYKVPLRGKTIREVWSSKEFSEFRSNEKNKCIQCDKKNLCMGGCGLNLEIDLC